MFEGSLKGLVLSDEANPQQSIPLQKVNIRQRILGLDSDNTALNLRWWLEVVLPYFDQMIHLRQKLNVHTESTVQVRAWLCNQSLRELLLEHEHSASEHRLLCEQLEDQGRTDLIRNVGHAYIEEGQLHLQHISRDKYKLIRIFRVLEPFGQLSHHPRVNLYRNDLLRPFEQQRSQITSSRSDLQHNICRPNGRFRDHFIEDMRVYENMLAVGLVEDHTCPVYSLLLLYHDC